MPVFNNALAGAAGSGGAAAGDYNISRSLRFHADSIENSWLSKTFNTGDRKKFTISFWIKFTEFPSHDNVIFGHMVSGYQTQTMIRRNSLGYLEFGQFTGSWNFRKITNRVFNDPSAWYHIVWAVDTTLGTAEDRVKLYVNGVRETSWSTNTNPSEDFECLVNSSVQFGIGKALPVTQYAGNFYLADWHLVDGQALAPDGVFGGFDADTGVWGPVRFTGNHNVGSGVNGHHLDFSDNSKNGTLGDDRKSPDYDKTVGALTTTTGNGSFYSNTNPYRAFDGNTGNEVYGGWATAGDDSNVIWTPPSGLYSVSSSLRVYAGYYSTIYVNGVSKATGAESTNSAWITLNHTGAISSIKVENTVNDNVARISAIEINGTILVAKAWDVNNLVATPSVGTTSYDGGNYLKNVTYTNTAGNYNDLGTYAWNVKAFDGQLNTSFGVSTGGGTTTVTWTPSSAISATSFRFYMGNSWNIGGTTYEISYNINGTGWTVLGSTSDSNAVGAAARWNSVSVPNNSLTSFAVKTVSQGSGWGSGSWSAIEVNGTILIENGHPPNTDSLLDTPTDYEADSGNNGGNYATFNPLNHIRNGTLSNGNLEVTGGSTTFHGFSTIGLTSGKWYVEMTGQKGGGSSNMELGIVDLQQLGTNPTQVFDAFSRGFGYRNDANKITNNGATNYGATYSNPDIIGMAVDLDNGTLTFYKNGVSQGTAFTGIPSGYTYHIAVFVRNNVDKVAINFGQRPFAISSIPSGYKPLCTQNLDAPAITKPSEHFDVVTYNGTGQSQSITGLDFQPDIAWIKERNGTSWHRIIDSVRGQKELFPNDDNVEVSFTQGLNSFTSGGFNLGNGTDSNVNTINKTYVGWLWKAPTSFTNGVNANGATLASSGKVNQTAGISIVTYDYTGTSQYGYAHGLNKKPDLVIRKAKELTESWSVYHSSMGFDERSNLDNTNASSGTTTFRSDQGDPTSTLNYINNNNTSEGLEYVFTAVPGFSAFGRYEGTGTAEGPFQYCGFTPRWILIKNADNGSNRNWIIIDTKRSTFNINDGETVLFANQGDTESYANDSYGRFDNKDAIDILSNGFRVTEPNTSGVWTQVNNTDQTHIWAAFADVPFKYARAF